jgi:hypothetical protein
MTHYIEVRSGKAFHPLAPVVADIDPEDIAHALSHQCRFSGHTIVHYSVAEHCVRVAGLLREWGEDTSVQLWGLLHDATEAYLVDVPLPLKRHPDFIPYLEAEARLMRAVCLRFGLPQDQPVPVLRADQVLLATEARDLMPYRPEHWAGLPQRPLPGAIVPWPAHAASVHWLTLFRELSK